MVTGEQPSSTQDKSSPSYLGVRLLRDAVVEREDERDVIRIPRERVDQLRRDFGWRAERPLLQVILGAVFLAPVAAVLWYGIIEGPAEDTIVTITPRMVVALLTVTVLGAYILYRAFQRGHYLLAVFSDGSSRKLLFHGKFVEEDYQRFAEAAQQQALYRLTE